MDRLDPVGSIDHLWKTGAWWTRVIFKSKECSLSLEYQIVKYQIMPLFPSKPGCLFTEECLKVFCFLYSRLLFVMTNTWTCTYSLTCHSSLNPVPQWTLPPVEGGVKRRMTSQTNELGSYSWILVQGGWGGVRVCILNSNQFLKNAAVDIGLRVYFT